MTEPQNQSPRSRMQALLAIPDNQRSEEQWDELHELEITLAPGNRIGHQDKQPPAGGQGKGRGGAGGNSRGGNPQGQPRGESRGENRGGGRSGRNPQGPRPPQVAGPRPVVEPSAPVEGSAEVVVDGAATKKPFRRFHKKPPKPVAT